MDRKTQQWQVHPIGHAGWLGFFLWLCLLLFLVVWIAQYALGWAVALSLVGGALAINALIRSSSNPKQELRLCRHSGRLLSELAGPLQPRRMWCSPYFCTLLLDTDSESGAKQRWVVCWRHHHTAEQWRALVRLLRTGAWAPQAMRNH